MVIGNYVKIIYDGKQYSNYTLMFEKFHFKNIKDTRYCSKGDKGYIFAIGKHPNDNLTTLYGVNLDNGKQVLIGNGGIELTDKTHEIW